MTCVSQATARALEFHETTCPLRRQRPRLPALWSWLTNASQKTLFGLFGLHRQSLQLPHCFAGSPRDAAQSQNAEERIIESPIIMAGNAGKHAAFAFLESPDQRPGHT